jgi:hypothetical protein
MTRQDWLANQNTVSWWTYVPRQGERESRYCIRTMDNRKSTESWEDLAQDPRTKRKWKSE